MHVTAGAHGLSESHVRRLVQQRVVQEVADVHEQRADDRRLPDEDEQRIDRRLCQDLATA